MSAEPTGRRGRCKPIREAFGTPPCLVGTAGERLTEANEQHAKPRNPLGRRTLHSYAGDCRITPKAQGE